MRFLHCQHDAHAAAILEILNEAIVHSTAIYDYEPRTPQSMAAWFSAKEEGGFPVIGAVDEGGQLLGFASYGTFRAWPAYRYSVEHSVYVHADHRCKGIGIALMTQLIAAATAQDFHTLIGGIDATNKISITMHEKLGFVHAGTIRQAGYKFSRWLDLAFYQLLLSTPAHPIGGGPTTR